ncbi:J domain-containing protein [Microbacterium sp. nov. GSS16]|nr:J domain-containing protein [Microbacterium sp. nov. GSS16]WCD93494.1 J domain-containing protein [Microbacterium sp. nov. GSS16]
MVTFDGPLSASAYELLGVESTVSDDELRRAYRLRLRQTHPDTGGDAAVFVRVQRAWELVGTAAARAAYDRGRGAASWAARPTTPGATGTRPRGRSYGRAGAWRRRRYRELLSDQLGHEVTDAEAYDPLVVRAAPWEARRMLADALAEEATAEAIEELGIGFTAWHDVVTGEDAAGKLDHVVLSPSGLYGLMSEDFGGPVRFRQGEVIGAHVGGAAPIRELLARMRTVARRARVRFGGAILILPDDDLDDAVAPLGSIRGVPVVVVRRSALRTVLRSGVPRARVLGGNEAFDVRSRLTHSARVLSP